MTIGEAAERSGTPPKTIRYYEEIGLIGPAERLENGYRAYGENDVHTLRFVHHARSLGFPLADIRALLSLYRDRARESRDVKRVALQHIAELDRRILEMNAMRNVLADLANRCQDNERPECPILDELEKPERH
jgi:MerR family copper efflux transcriptional regulator